MHCELPRRVRRAIADISGVQISHATTWGCYSPRRDRWGQLADTYPGECRWEITGGQEWPLKDTSVSVTAQRGEHGRTEICVVGREAVEAEVLKFEDQLNTEGSHSDPWVQNRRDGLAAVLAVLKAASTKGRVR